MVYLTRILTPEIMDLIKDSDQNNYLDEEKNECDKTILIEERE